MGVSPSSEGGCLALLPSIALLAGSSGTATSEFGLDSNHGHRRLVGVSVNCHIQSQDQHTYITYITLKKKIIIIIIIILKTLFLRRLNVPCDVIRSSVGSYRG